MYEDMMAALFGTASSTISDIVYTWAVYLDSFFSRVFPVPSKLQMLRAYPTRVLASFGHARIFMHLDATEVRAEVPSIKAAHSAMHSAYKGCSTIKFLAACDTIGVVWHKSVSGGFPGAISDPVQTTVTGIIMEKNIPRGLAVCVDKGFLIENECAKHGVSCIRPTKKRKGQKQQSEKETNLTQKIGNSRIVIEQDNGQMKMSNRYFNGKVPPTQTRLVSYLFRNAFMITNFKVPFTIGNREGSTAGRPCKGADRYAGARDKGTADLTHVPRAWASKTEKASIKAMMAANSSLTEGGAAVSRLLGAGARHGRAAVAVQWQHAHGHISHFP